MSIGGRSGWSAGTMLACSDATPQSCATCQGRLNSSDLPAWPGGPAQLATGGSFGSTAISQAPSNPNQRLTRSVPPWSNRPAACQL